MGMMDPIAYWLVTILLTIAMFTHGMTSQPSRADIGWMLTMLGWGAVVARFWHGALLSGDTTISWAGGAGLLLLACGQILSSLGPTRRERGV